MQWFYAINGNRLGPASPEQFAALVAAGTITEETLVWREGFGEWEPWGKVAAANPLPEPSADAPLPPPMVVEDDEATGDHVEDETTSWSMDEYSANLEEQGFSTSIGGCLSRAWDNYKSFFGVALGAVVVAYLVLMVAGMIPVLGVLSGIIVGPHINAGVAWIFLKRARGESVELGNVFDGFKRCYVKLLLVGLVQMAAAIAVALVFVIPMMLMGMPLGADGIDPAAPPEIPPDMIAGIGFLAILMAAVFVFLSVRFLLAQLIALDRPEGAVDAYRLSWRITRGRFWTIFALMVVLMILGMAGVLALLVGLIFVLPFYGAIIAQLYHDANQSAAGRPPE
jgi:hypothetical protein